MIKYSNKFLNYHFIVIILLSLSLVPYAFSSNDEITNDNSTDEEKMPPFEEAKLRFSQMNQNACGISPQILAQEIVQMEVDGSRLRDLAIRSSNCFSEKKYPHIRQILFDQGDGGDQSLNSIKILREKSPFSITSIKKLSDGNFKITYNLFLSLDHVADYSGKSDQSRSKVQDDGAKSFKILQDEIIFAYQHKELIKNLGCVSIIREPNFIAVRKSCASKFVSNKNK